MKKKKYYLGQNRIQSEEGTVSSVLVDVNGRIDSCMKTKVHPLSFKGTKTYKSIWSLAGLKVD